MSLAGISVGELAEYGLDVRVVNLLEREVGLYLSDIERFGIKNIGRIRGMGPAYVRFFLSALSRLKHAHGVDTYYRFSGGPFDFWYPCSFVVAGIRYNCLEQFVQHRKASINGDLVKASTIMEKSDPWEQRLLGKSVDGGFGDYALDLCVVGNKAKFGSSSYLRGLLKEVTGVFAYFDKSQLWGTGTTNKEVGPRLWTGKNLLGEALTETRESCT